MSFQPAIGVSDFRVIREQGAGYIDKTGLISEILRDQTQIFLFPRPRRFGKTLNMFTLAYFLEKTKENLSHLFEGLEVFRDSEARKHFQRHPVIFLSFKDVKGRTFHDALDGIRAQLMRAFREHRHLLESNLLDSSSKKLFERMLDGSSTTQDLKDAVLSLSQVLFEHHGERVVVLIDEYDTPIQSGYVCDYFDEIADFFRNFFAAGLKDNKAIFKSVLTGILRVSKESMFSGLNNVRVHSTLSPHYNRYFGFTDEEIATVIPAPRLDEVRAWYDGYNFGGRAIYNPWSILCFIDEGLIKPYWVNTGSTELLEKIALKRGLGFSWPSEALLRGETIDVAFDENIVLRDIEHDEEALWNFLVAAGYLKVASTILVEGRMTASLCIPNKEIRIVYEDLFHKWLKRGLPQMGDIDTLAKSIVQGDVATMQAYIERFLLTVLSYQDPIGREPEKLYHGFILGLLVQFGKEYEVRSNRESGLGRADVLIRPKVAGRTGVVMELKVPGENETSAHALVSAAKQVRDRKYATELELAGASPVYEYAMVFDGKRVWVKHVRDVLAELAEREAQAKTRSSKASRKRKATSAR